MALGENVKWDVNYKGTGVVLTNDDLTANVPSLYNLARATIGRSSGKWYWEITVVSTNNGQIGICSESTPAQSPTSATMRLYRNNGYRYPEANSWGAAYGAGDIIGFAMNLDIGTLEIFKNGVSQGISHSNLQSMGTVYPCLTSASSATGMVGTANFGATPFKYNIPAGFTDYNNVSKGRMLLAKNDKYYTSETINSWYSTSMVGSSSPAPLAATSSQEGRPSWRAFDGIVSNVATTSSWTTTNAVNGWLQINYGRPVKVNRVNMVILNAPSAPKKFQFLGSDDGATWTLLHEADNVVDWEKGKFNEERVFNFNKTVENRYYRLNIISTVGNILPVIVELTYGLLDKTYTKLPVVNKDNFIKYGSNPMVGIEYTTKKMNYILQDSVSKNNQGLLVTQLDRKPTSLSLR